MDRPVVRVSILRCRPERFAEFASMMAEAEPVPAPGTRAMSGLISYRAGSDEATSSLSNASVRRTLDDGGGMGRFQPMLDVGEAFAEKGAVFERPVMNYATMLGIPGRGA